MSVPAVGQPAPDFTVPSTAGAMVTLSQYRGHQPVLLAFFPLAFTRVCTVEMCAFTEDYDAFAKRGVVVHPISVDFVPSLKAWKEQLGMKVDLLSDFKREVSAQYGVFLPDKQTSKRAYFLIDVDGILRWAHVEEHGGLRRENGEILGEIEKLASSAAS